MANALEQYPRAPYNSFRKPGEIFNQGLLQSGGLSKTFDEPTYLTFRLTFSYENTNVDNTNYDRLPMPLFSKYTEDDITARNYYSTYQYLRDNNEMVRANMMLDFVDRWNDLQWNYQWYFQTVSGLDSILSVDPAKGMRVPQDARITIKMLEGLDLRVTHLLDLYRKIAWDDVYQRWILPDMMRHFKLYIYVTEFRSFHKSNISSQLLPGGDNPPLILELIDEFTPVYVIELERCEFDITSIKKIPDSLTVADAEMREIEFSIKVGNLRERYINPMLNFFYYDWLVNGFERVSETPNINRLTSTTDPTINPVLSSYAKGDALANPSHQSATPFVQTGYMDNMKNASPNYDVDVSEVNPIDPATWTGNALTAGKALAKNLVKTQVDKAKMQNIPGLGISFTEAIAAIQSKNVFTLFGAARRAIEQTIKGTLPSQELEKHMVDTQLREFLLGISESTATDDNTIKLQQAANLALNDRGQWEKITDLSKATDLISVALNEINSLNKIENRNALKQIYNQPYSSIPIQDLLVYEGIPTSVSTQNRNLEGQKIMQPPVGQATSDQNPSIEHGLTTNLGSTNGDLGSGSTIAASVELGNSAGSGLPQPASGLGSFAQGGMNSAIPSEQLGSDAGEPGESTTIGLGSVAEGGYDIPKPSEKLGSNAGEAGQPIAGGLGSKVEGGKINLPQPGEAVDTDHIEAKSLPRPAPSQATNNRIQE